MPEATSRNTCTSRSVSGPFFPHRDSCASARASSTAAPRRAKASRAARQLERRILLVPQPRHAEAIRQPHPRRFVRGIQLAPQIPRLPQLRKRPCRIALRQQHGARAAAARARTNGISYRLAISTSSSDAARAAPTSWAASTDLDVRVQNPRPGRRLPYLLRHPADRGLGRIDPALRQPQLRHSRTRSAVRLAGLAVRFFGVLELAETAGESRPPGTRPPPNPDAARAGTTTPPPFCAHARASAHAPCSCKSSARRTWQWPRKGTRSGCDAHHFSSAAVHSCARRRSQISPQPSSTLQ